MVVHKNRFALKLKRKDVITMVCTSVKEGLECYFMSKEGCGFNGGTCHLVVEECEGCQKVKEFLTGNYCLAFPDPAAKWRLGKCSMATHLKEETSKGNGKLNPLKASKRKIH
jgi:hypothetical protein